MDYNLKGRPSNKDLVELWEAIGKARWHHDDLPQREDQAYLNAQAYKDRPTPGPRPGNYQAAYHGMASGDRVP